MSKNIRENFSTIEKLRIRKNFGKKKVTLKFPNFIKIQLDSYKNFLQEKIAPEKRENIGLHGVFLSIFPIISSDSLIKIEYIDYTLEKPVFNTEECLIKGLTYLSSLKVKLRIIIFEKKKNTESNDKVIKSIKVYETFMSDIPLMTEDGSMIINGTKRVVVSQLHKSPGVFFEHDEGKNHSSGKLLYSARIVPYRGSWIDFEFDIKNCLFIRIDRKRKFPVTIFLKALNLTKEQILDTFSSKVTINVYHDKRIFTIRKKDLIFFDIQNTHNHNKKDIVEINIKYLLNRVSSEDIVLETGEIIIEKGQKFSEDILKNIVSIKTINKINILTNDDNNNYIADTLKIDNTNSYLDALLFIYKMIRPGEPPTQESAKSLFNSLFFSKEKYDLSNVGRIKFNKRLNINYSNDRILSKDDIIFTIKYLINTKNNNSRTDDIDHLGNRRVRSIGEMTENQFRIGLIRLERSIKEKMSFSDINNLKIRDLFNTKLISMVIKEFFGSSQLSQFMDQNNPLAELTHKRRISALGPGGLTRERAGFEVRDVHPTHYGRLCPIETPEGPNIGLINSLAIYGKINVWGFIETPCKKVVNKRVTDEIYYLSASEEEKYYIAPADIAVDTDNIIIDELVSCRYKGESTQIDAYKINYIDVSPQQIVSVASALIPFLEHDDANRALMGANMQRQAVPLLITEKPLVGTGIEEKIISNSGNFISAKNPGIVYDVDYSKIVIYNDNTFNIDIYELNKFSRSNQNTLINQYPIVQKGSIVQKGDTLVDGPSSDLGELSLGKNLLVAFMPWNGFNFEDSIIISDKLVKKDTFTSIHIYEYSCIARDTKLGIEEITNDIPNINESFLSKLDDNGIIYKGAKVKSGDILVGKVTPKRSVQLAPEEKLLQAIFGEKASNVTDSSLRVPSNIQGTVVDIQVYSRDSRKKDKKISEIEKEKLEILENNINEKYNIQYKILFKKLLYFLECEEFFFKKELINEKNKKIIYNFSFDDIKHISFNKDNDNIKYCIQIINKISDIKKNHTLKVKQLKKNFFRGYELAPGILKIVKVYIAVKRVVQTGDKMSGRHGNKGVISTIVPETDMPYLESGETIDIILNPLGVPSRMNIGQILETHLGLAAKLSGKKIQDALEKFYRGIESIRDIRKTLEYLYNIGNVEKISLNTLSDKEILTLSNNLIDGVPCATPVFDGASEKEIREFLQINGMDPSGKAQLIDGRTGEYFKRTVTIGYIYMLKLNHLVDDKIHSRSTGSYSLVTQQPLGGKAQFGGQRFGEMEVWALEAYGAAYTLQEMLTVKSDDVEGRTKVYRNIVEGKHDMNANIPESFNVLVKEIRSLGINIKLEKINS